LLEEYISDIKTKRYLKRKIFAISDFSYKNNSTIGYLQAESDFEIE
jgi:hypothetical protein